MAFPACLKEALLKEFGPYTFEVKHWVWLYLIYNENTSPALGTRFLLTAVAVLSSYSIHLLLKSSGIVGKFTSYFLSLEMYLFVLFGISGHYDDSVLSVLRDFLLGVHHLQIK